MNRYLFYKEFIDENESVEKGRQYGKKIFGSIDFMGLSWYDVASE